MSARQLAEPAKAQVRIADLYGSIQEELAEVERVYAQELGCRHGFIQQLVDHCGNFRGKRLRPALVLFSGQACGELSHSHTIAAAVVEMIHTATLIHDDILDEAVIRRHCATINAEWGNETAVLMGDYLFTHAFHLAALLDNTMICRWIGRATNLVCEGEMLQVHSRGNFDLDESTYFTIIQGKTAELIAVSCRLGAFFAGASDDVVTGLHEYGRQLGLAFQIADDVLDIWGEERIAGKSLGTDLEKQKLTLPLIRLFEVADPNLLRQTQAILTEAAPDARRRLRPILEETGALEYAWDRAEDCIANAIAALAPVRESRTKQILIAMARAVIKRQY